MDFGIGEFREDGGGSSNTSNIEAKQLQDVAECGAKTRRKAKKPGHSSSTNNKTKARHARWAEENRKLHETVTTIIRADARLTNCGADPVIDKLAKEHHFGAFDLDSLRLLFGKQAFTVVFAPRRIWKDKAAFRDLLKVKNASAALGIRIVLLCASTFEHSERLNVARALASARTIRPTRDERMKIMEHVLKNTNVSIGACAALVQDSDDPVGVILSLCATRWLRVKNDGKPLSYDTKVSPGL